MATFNSQTGLKKMGMSGCSRPQEGGVDTPPTAGKQPVPLPCRGWTVSRIKTQSAIRDAPNDSRTPRVGNFQLDAPYYGPSRFLWICLPHQLFFFF